MSEFPTQPKFEVIKKLSNSDFGAIYKILNKEDNNYYSIKKISLKSVEENEINEIKNVSKILSELKSENIIKYYDSFEDKTAFNIIMEYCDGLDLRKFIDEHKKSNNYIKKNIILHIILEICNGLKELHNNNLIHRDLKPENLFLNADLTIKIGDFGFTRKFQNIYDYVRTKMISMLYMAPEIFNEEKYDNKVDIWALGCIIYELCTLNYCFENKSMNDLLRKITNNNHGKIDINIYGEDLQNLIDSLLNKNYKERPSVDDIIKTITQNLSESFKENIIEIYLEDEIYKNYIIERNVFNSINQVEQTIISKEKKYNKIKYSLGVYLVELPLTIAASLLTFGLSLVAYFAIKYTTGIGLGFVTRKIVNPDEKEEFLFNNSVIMQTIQNKLMIIIKEEFDKNIPKQNIIIYNKENFDNIIIKIKNKLLKEEYIKRLQKIITKNFNILLLGCTNAGKSTLINEFLKLPDNKKAAESTGGPTDTKDFTPYTEKNNNKLYTLYDTNGITNKGNDSIESKQINTKNEIEKRLKDNDPNKLIHCIWYCFQGSNVQPSDKDFIQSLLNIYTTYTIPIIYIHTQTYSIGQSETCKKGIEKYLNEIYNNDKTKVEQQLNNYINILARGDEEEDEEAFGLDELEKLSQKEIEEKGLKSSYFEYIKQDIIPILINGVFNLIFTEFNIKKLTKNSMESIEKFLETMLSIVNSDKLGLSQDIKDKNKNSLINICECFKNIRDKLKEDLMDLLEIQKLKKDYQDYIKSVYEEKPDYYKKEMTYEKFCKNVENLIYDNFAHNKKEIINNIINQGFIFYIFEVIKSGINEQFKESEEKILNEIYTEIFKELNKN